MRHFPSCRRISSYSSTCGDPRHRPQRRSHSPPPASPRTRSPPASGPMALALTSPLTSALPSSTRPTRRRPSTRCRARSMPPPSRSCSSNRLIPARCHQRPAAPGLRRRGGARPTPRPPSSAPRRCLRPIPQAASARRSGPRASAAGITSAAIPMPQPSTAPVAASSSALTIQSAKPGGWVSPAATATRASMSAPSPPRAASTAMTLRSMAERITANFGLRLGAAYTWNNVSASRTVAFPGLRRSAYQQLQRRHGPGLWRSRL